MSAHNADEFIAQAVDSVLSQHGVDLEFIIVNDRSNDRTPEILKQYLNSDKRIKIIHRIEKRDCYTESKFPQSGDREISVIYPTNGHGGQTEGLNVGLKYCTGKYIARLDSDDICCENRLKTQYEFMESNPDIGFLGGSAIRIDSDGKIIGNYHNDPLTHEEIVTRIRNYQPYCPHSTWFVRKSLYDQLQGYDQDGYRAEDLDFMLRATEISDVKFAFMQTPAIYFRMHSAGLSYNINSAQIDYAIAAMARHLLRTRGVSIGSDMKESILEKSREIVRITGLQKNTAAYNALVTGFAALKAGSFSRMVKAISVIFSSDPLIWFHLKDLSQKKLAAANKVASQFERNIN